MKTWSWVHPPRHFCMCVYLDGTVACRRPSMPCRWASANLDLSLSKTEQSSQKHITCTASKGEEWNKDCVAFCHIYCMSWIPWVNHLPVKHCFPTPLQFWRRLSLRCTSWLWLWCTLLQTPPKTLTHCSLERLHTAVRNKHLAGVWSTICVCLWEVCSHSTNIFVGHDGLRVVLRLIHKCCKGRCLSLTSQWWTTEAMNCWIFFHCHWVKWTARKIYSQIPQMCNTESL